MKPALLVVDVQPQYTNSNDIVRDITDLINQTDLPVVITWVGSPLSLDTAEAVKDYLIRNGVQRLKLNAATIVEKEWGWLDAFITSGFPDDVIVKIGTYMREHGIRNSRQVTIGDVFGEEIPVVEGVFPYALEDYWSMASIRLPTANENLFLQFDSYQTCGGGADECLKEMELWLRILGKQVTRLEDHLVYQGQRYS